MRRGPFVVVCVSQILGLGSGRNTEFVVVGGGCWVGVLESDCWADDGVVAYGAIEAFGWGFVAIGAVEYGGLESGGDVLQCGGVGEGKNLGEEDVVFCGCVDEWGG